MLLGSYLRMYESDRNDQKLFGLARQRTPVIDPECYRNVDNFSPQ